MDDSNRKHYSPHEWAIQTVYDYIKQNVGKQEFVIIRNPSTSFYKITQKGEAPKGRNTFDRVTKSRRKITGIKDNPKLGGGILASHLQSS
jgi:hypothetical protein